MEEYFEMWKNYFNFSGRSTRREFWLAYLFNYVQQVIWVIDMDAARHIHKI